MSDMKLPRPSLREDFRKRLRADLMSEAVALAEERRLRRASLASRVAAWWSAGRLRPIAVAATLAAILALGAGTAAAGSLPGEPAFAIKQAAEQVELAFAANDDAKVQVLAAQAQRRLDELQQATSERPDKAPTASVAYEAAVQRFASAVEALRSAAPGTKHDAVEQVVEAAHDKHIEILQDLKDRLPEPAQEKIERAIEEHQKLSPGRPEPPRPTGRPGSAPRSGEPGRPAAPSPTRETERPRASETPRGGRPTTPTPTATPR